MTTHNPETPESRLEKAFAVLDKGLDPFMSRLGNRVSMLGLFVNNDEAARAQEKLQTLGLKATILEGRRVSIDHVFSDEEIAHLQNSTFERLRKI